MYASACSLAMYSVYSVHTELSLVARGDASDARLMLLRKSTCQPLVPSFIPARYKINKHEHINL